MKGERNVIHRVVASCLIVVGALVGGVFPGAGIAFAIAGSIEISGSAGEAICVAINLVFGVGGALCGAVIAQAIKPMESWRWRVVLAVILGTLAGWAGYRWLYWLLTHGDYPL